MGATLFTDNPDPLYKVRLATGSDNVEVGFTHWLSVAEGEMDGFYGQVRGDINIGERTIGDLFGGFDFARGSNADVSLRPENESQTVYVGLSIKPVAAFSVSGTLEHIRDLDSAKEWRGLFSIGYRFAGSRPGVHP
jgi:hypothetical protein